MSDPKSLGLLAQFETPADIMHAAMAVRDAGFSKWDVFTPFPIHGMDDAMALPSSKVGFFTFVGGVTGFFSGMGMIWFMNKFDYPLVVGGKPLFTPLFAFPVSYELTILLSAFGTLFGLALLNRLPKLNNPLFSSERFKRATNDKFFVYVETADPKFSAVETRALLATLGASAVEEIHDTEA
jgi:hypothetical protein